MSNTPPVNGNGTRSWTLIVSGLTIAFSLTAGAWVIIDLKIENAVARATAERNAQLAELREQVKSGEALTRARLTEVETQIHGIYQIKNIQQAETQRFISILWGKNFPDNPYPLSQFFPGPASVSSP